VEVRRGRGVVKAVRITRLNKEVFRKHRERRGEGARKESKRIPRGE
jgi:hypothetical protein